MAGAIRNWRRPVRPRIWQGHRRLRFPCRFPYSISIVTKNEDADEWAGVFKVAARLVCQEIGQQISASQFPIIEGYSAPNDVRVTARESMEEAKWTSPQPT
jgi:hypothetical protein